MFRSAPQRSAALRSGASSQLPLSLPPPPTAWPTTSPNRAPALPLALTSTLNPSGARLCAALPSGAAATLGTPPCAASPDPGPPLPPGSPAGLPLFFCSSRRGWGWVCGWCTLGVVWCGVVCVCVYCILRCVVCIKKKPSGMRAWNTTEHHGTPQTSS